MSDNLKTQSPRHVGIIMDGNGRWAKKRAMPRNYGHSKGVDTIQKVAQGAFDLGVECISVFGFSTENAARPKDEVEGLIDLIRKRLRKMVDILIKNGVRLMFMGDLSFFPDDVNRIFEQVIQDSKDGDKGVFNLAFNYGARAEIVRAAALAAKSGEVNEQTIERNLYTCDLPPLDLIIRTGGEVRLSNFMLYQAAYSELFFTETLWPDFSVEELKEIFTQFQHRNRRFGGV